MKFNTSKYYILLGFVIILVACSTKKNTFVSRNSHALSTEFNILYNGEIALNKGVADLKMAYKDNFWETLPVERMQITEEQMLPGDAKNANFERAESKATKAIQKHSMKIDGGEKNPQMDEAHLLLGKTRYYDQRFVPALEAFNYVLYKYPNSDKIYEVKIWREKTNMRMDNDALAITNLRKLLKEIKFKDQIFADANATLAQAFLNLKEKDSAISRLKTATQFTKIDEEKARYRFILAQVFEELGQKDSAYARYQQVIDMNRKSSRNYIIQAHARQAKQFNFEKGDTIAFVEKFNTLLKDRENRPFLDVINHQMALFYDKQKKTEVAKKYYNKSLKSNSQDNYLIASNYRNLAEIYFNKAKYVSAGKYFDSTLTVLNPRTREYKLIAKKRENLDDVIKFEGIAQRNDSILKVASFSQIEKENYYKEYIDKLKKEAQKQKELDIKQAKLKEQNGVKSDNLPAKTDVVNSSTSKQGAIAPPSSSNFGSTSTFYFYNASTVAFGKVEFKKKWGDRAHVENWRLSKEAAKEDKQDSDTDVVDGTDKDPKTKKVEEKYTTNYYLKQIPSSDKALDSIGKERNFAYFQLGVIYKEKFKEYKRAAEKLETLLNNKPEERLVLPSMYNLFKIYEIIDPSKALAMKAKIISQYPDSRYAQIIGNTSPENAIASTPEAAYDILYADYLKGLYRSVFTKTELAVEQFTGEELLPKFELLKANLIGKLKGLAEFKKALNYVALTYPNSTEGKETEVFIATKIPYLESLSFNSEVPTSWKILFSANDLEDKNSKILIQKVTQFAKERTVETLTVSTDIYTMDKNFIVIHGIKTAESAKGIATVLKEFKDYKIADPSIVISSENYKVVQVKKNIDEYTTGDWLNKPIVPIERTIAVATPKPVPEKILPSKRNEVKNKEEKAKEESKQMSTKNEIDSPDDLPKNMMPPAPDLPKKP